MLLSVKGPGAIHIAYEKTCVVKRLLFFFPQGPKAMFPPALQAHRIATNDFMFHPTEAPVVVKRDADEDEGDQFSEQAQRAYYVPKRRKRR